MADEEKGVDVVAVPSVNQAGESGQTNDFEVHDEDAAVEATAQALSTSGVEDAADKAEALVRGRQTQPETAVDVAPKEKATARKPRQTK